MTIGPMEGVAEVIAEINHELAGHLQTRLSADVLEGDVILPVESTVGWPDSGTVLAYGTLYAYTAKTLTTLEGISWSDGEVTTVGARQPMAVGTIVTDYSRSTSAMDQLRRAVLVDTADGEDLSVVGRNLSVLRLPFLRDDDRFRGLIKALAYNPRGTIRGLELVLTALVGAGNFEIFEDLINFPNRVFIRLLGDFSTSDIPEGHTYLRGEEILPSDAANQVTLGNDVVDRGQVTSVQLAPEAHTTDCRTQYPSADTLVEYGGGPTINPWSLVGTGVSEGADVTQPVSTPEAGYIEFTTVPPTDFCRYEHSSRLYNTSSPIGAEVNGALSIVAAVPSGASPDFQLVTGLLLSDGVRAGGVCITSDVGATYTVGLATFNFFSGIFFFTPTTFTFPKGDWHEIEIRLRAGAWWDLVVDGRVIDSIGYTSMPTAGTAIPSASGPVATFGHFGNALPTSNQLRVKQASYRSSYTADYNAINGVAALVNPDIVNDTTTPLFVADDVGKSIWIPLASSLVNRGLYEIYQRDSSSQVRVRGRLRAAQANVTAANQIEVTGEEQLFRYPDDIGKTIELSGSGLGNDGSYTITNLIEQGTGTDFDNYDTNQVTSPGLEATTTIALVSGALTVESDLDFRLNPNFSAAGSERYTMPGAGTVAGNVLTLRSGTLPHPVVVAVTYSVVLSAHLVIDAQVVNSILQDDPLLLEYYPFYLADPLSFIRQYLDDVTAAGVIPDYEF